LLGEILECSLVENVLRVLELDEELEITSTDKWAKED
jgi:hypothetical protein